MSDWAACPRPTHLQDGDGVGGWPNYPSRFSAIWRPSVRPSQPTRAISCYHLQQSLTFIIIIITHPESRYSFYCLTNTERLSRPRQSSKGLQTRLPLQWWMSDTAVFDCVMSHTSKSHTDNRPIIGTRRLLAVLPIISIGRLVPWHRLIVVYTIHDCLLKCEKQK